MKGINDLVDAVKQSVETKVSKAELKEIVKAAFAQTVELAKEDDGIRIPDFGTFNVSETKARKGRNPSTGEEITIKAGKRFGFKAAKGAKDAL